MRVRDTRRNRLRKSTRPVSRFVTVASTRDMYGFSRFTAALRASLSRNPRA